MVCGHFGETAILWYELRHLLQWPAMATRKVKMAIWQVETLSHVGSILNFDPPPPCDPKFSVTSRHVMSSAVVPTRRERVYAIHTVKKVIKFAFVIKWKKVSRWKFEEKNASLYESTSDLLYRFSHVLITVMSILHGKVINDLLPFKAFSRRISLMEERKYI